MRRPSASKLLTAGAILVSASAAAACGRTTVVGDNRMLTVGITEYRLAPQEVRVSQGLLTIVVHNYGRLTHSLAVSQDGQAEGATSPVGPGQSVELALQLPPGRYTMASTILSDQALGAYGSLTVTR
jgi:plastocyanin